MKDRKTKFRFNHLLAIVSAVLLLAASRTAFAFSGRVVDAVTKQPIAGALVTVDEVVQETDKNGVFQAETTGRIGVRAHGYRRGEVDANRPDGKGQDIELAPFAPKALYLSFFGVGDSGLRGAALQLLEETELNALVIDVKGDRGMIPYKSEVPLAASVRAERVTTVADIRGLIKSLRGKGVYTIARVVVFKDDPLASSRPDLALRTREGGLWRDREGLAWVDPFKEEVWKYNIAIAVEAARNGFDEIQFDYVRFPDANGLTFSQPNTEESRVKAISGFLAQARKALAPYNVFVAADIFGYVCWNRDDTDIGQRLEDIVPLVDYISPMLYPSGFQDGIPGYANPVQHPYEIVYLSLKRAGARTGVSAKRFRPWLQAFRDYAFDRRAFGGEEIRAQIRAAEHFGADGWMLWNPRNVYSAEGLKR